MHLPEVYPVQRSDFPCVRFLGISCLAGTILCLKEHACGGKPLILRCRDIPWNSMNLWSLETFHDLSPRLVTIVPWDVRRFRDVNGTQRLKKNRVMSRAAVPGWVWFKPQIYVVLVVWWSDGTIGMGIMWENLELPCQQSMDTRPRLSAAPDLRDHPQRFITDQQKGPISIHFHYTCEIDFTCGFWKNQFDQFALLVFFFWNIDPAKTSTSISLRQVVREATLLAEHLPGQVYPGLWGHGNPWEPCFSVLNNGAPNQLARMSATVLSVSDGLCVCTCLHHLTVADGLSGQCPRLQRLHQTMKGWLMDFPLSWMFADLCRLLYTNLHNMHI